MSESDLTPRSHPHQRSSATSVIFVLLTTLAGFIIIGPLIGFLLAIPFIHGSILEFATKIGDPMSYPEIKTPFFIIQGCATLIGLVVGPSIYWIASEKRNVLDFIKNKSTPAIVFMLTPIIVILFMAPDSVLIDWNAHFSFPEFLKGFEAWARDREDYAEKLTRFLTTFASTGEFLFAFLVIAILPAIGEELVFRGMLQPLLQRATNRTHLAIWISAFLFSALHMQFFGFVPRVLLGALFGYLYSWSGNLMVPMFAHFINNGFSVILLYLHQLGKIDIDVENTDAAPWPVVISGTILTFGLLAYLKRFLQRNPTAP